MSKNSVIVKGLILGPERSGKKTIQSLLKNNEIFKSDLYDPDFDIND